MYKIIKFGDKNGVGSIVECTNFWGVKNTYTFLDNVAGLDK